MIPYRVFGESLGFLFRKYFCVSLVLVGDVWLLFGSGVSHRDFANEVAVLYEGSWLVDRSWCESGPLCIWGPEYDG